MGAAVIPLFSITIFEGRKNWDVALSSFARGEKCHETH